MLATWLIHWGFTRDDAIWLWGRILGAAGILSSGVLDLNAQLLSMGIAFQFSPAELKIITSVSALILWISGKQASSRLPSGDK